MQKLSSISIMLDSFLLYKTFINTIICNINVLKMQSDCNIIVTFICYNINKKIFKGECI